MPFAENTVSQSGAYDKHNTSTPDRGALEWDMQRPADYAAAASAVRVAATTPGPVYVRLGRAGVPAVYEYGSELAIGSAYVLRPGTDVTILACGLEVAQALIAAENLSAQGISADMAYDVHSCIKKVTEDYEKMKYNTAIAAMMTLVNAIYAKGSVTRGELLALVKLLNPVAPHITEEINRLCKLADAELMVSEWPKYDETALVKDTVEVALQINGKLRGRMDVPSDLTREAANDYFLALDEVKKLIGDKRVRKLIFVPGRLVNIVIG